MKTTDTHLYFFSGNEVYSNFYPSEFRDGDKLFSSSEQAFMWQKAKFFNDPATALDILLAETPAQAKRLGRKVVDYNDDAWECVRLGFMTYACWLKFSQNEDLKKQLLSTGNLILVEASPYDKVWGVGLSEDDPDILDRTKWQGRNLLGLALMRVRQLLKNK